jgi:heme-degrading monooxygenase HmoA
VRTQDLTPDLGSRAVWARVSTFALPVEDMENVVEQFHEVVDAFLGQPGLKGVDVFVNRKNARAFTVTLWESEGAMKASEEAAEHLRSQVALDLHGWIDSVHEYELIRTELRQTVGGGGS